MKQTGLVTLSKWHNSRTRLYIKTELDETQALCGPLCSFILYICSVPGSEVTMEASGLGCHGSWWSRSCPHRAHSLEIDYGKSVWQVSIEEDRVL